MFTAASRTAANPKLFDKVPKKEASLLETKANNPPTTITEDIAFVTAIKGVCNAGVTLHTT